MFKVGDKVLCYKKGYDDGYMRQGIIKFKQMDIYLVDICDSDFNSYGYDYEDFTIRELKLDKLRIRIDKINDIIKQ